jgi:hypothetical protein
VGVSLLHFIRKELNMEYLSYDPNITLVSKKVTVEVNGEDKNYTNFFLVTPNGKWVAVKPAFKNDYKVLVVLSKEVKE